MEKLEANGNLHNKITFLNKFSWEKLALNDAKKAVVGNLIVEFSDIFAPKVRYDTDFKGKITPKRSIPIYE